MKTLTHATNVRFLSRKNIRQIIPVSDMSLWRWMRMGIFPAAVKINGRNYWRQSDIDAWLASQRHNNGSSGC